MCRLLLNAHRIFLLVLVGCFLFTTTSAFGEPINIGISLPLSGEAATYGADYQKIYAFANKKLAQNAYNLIFEDDRCSGKEAVTVAQKLISVNKVKHVLGLTCDTTFSSASSTYERSGVTVISTSANFVTGKYLFHTNLGAISFAQPIYEYVMPRHSTLGLIYEETVFATNFTNSLIGLNIDHPLNFVKESFVSNEVNVKPQILRVKQSNPEAIIVVPQSEDSLYRIVKQLHEMNWTIPIYSTFFPAAHSFLEKAGVLSEDIVFSDFPDLMSVMNEGGKVLYQEYVAINGEPASGPGLFPGAIEAFRAMDQAIRSGKPAPEYLSNTTFNGVLGTWRFGSDGIWNGYRPIVKRIKDGKPEPIM